MFQLVLDQLLKMLIIMVVGFGCFKLKLFDQRANEVFSTLLIQIVTPVLVVYAFQIDYDPQLITGFFQTFLIGLIVTVLGIFVVPLAFPARRPSSGIERFSAIYPNCGFIGIPIIRSVAGQKGVFYLTALIALYAIFSWTHGVIIIQNRFTLSELKKGLFSPVIISTLIGLFLFFARIRLPNVLLDSMSFIADMNTPLAMLIAGLSIAQCDLTTSFKKPGIYRVAVARLVAFPLVTIGVIALIGADPIVGSTALIALACPVATTVSLLSIRYKLDYRYAAEIFSSTAILCMLTIPVMVFLADRLLGW